MQQLLLNISRIEYIFYRTNEIFQLYDDITVLHDNQFIGKSAVVLQTFLRSARRVPFFRRNYVR